MHTVLYLDTYIFINTIFNFLIITSSLITNKIKVKLRISIVASIIMSVFSVIGLFTNIHKFLLKTIPIICLPFFLFKGSKTLKNKFICTFLLYQNIISGIVLSLNNTNDIISVKNTYYSYVSVSGIITSVLLIPLLMLALYKHVSKQLMYPSNYKVVEIVYQGKSIELMGFCDSGNNLIDYNNNCPVFVATNKILNSIPNPDVVNIIEYKTISGCGKMKVFNPDKIIIDSKPFRAVIGITDFKFHNDCDILLNNDVLSGNINTKNSETENFICL